MPTSADVLAPLSSCSLITESNKHSGAGESLVTVEQVGQDDSTLRTIDELLRSRAKTHSNHNILSYPAKGLDYVDYTFQQLDVFAFRVAKHVGASIPPRSSSSMKRDTVAILGPSNLEYLITMMALIKLGHTVLFLSTRILPVAIESLMKTTGASYILADSRHLESAVAVKESLPGLAVLNMPSRELFEFPVESYVDTQLDASLDSEIETDEIVYIIHSSGSTGLPKPIYQKQRAALANFSNNMDMKAFITLPLYHNHGLCNLYRSIWSCKQIHWYNADLPLTSDYLVQVIRAHTFDIFYGVPYALKLLAESDEGLNLLAKMKMVMYGGSACPDNLGDILVERGVNLVSHYGTTEVGQLMTSLRPAGDKAWNYVREEAKLLPFLRWIPRGPNLFECCILLGWPAKTATNMEDGSYCTKDLFEPHPTISGAWKYIARLDDTIVLVNGEKFNPVVTEGKIRSSKLVTETVIFGVQQPYLGALVIPSMATEGKPPSEVLELIWPVIEAAQEENDAFAKLSKEMVVILPHKTEYPRTDKGSIIRQAFYKAFAEEITKAYSNASSTNGQARAMTEPELRDFLRSLVSKSRPKAMLDDDMDLFALGLDSLQSMQIRAEIVRNVKTESKLTQNVVFENPTISKLTVYLLGNSGKEEKAGASIENEMCSLVEKYSNFTYPPRQTGRSVVVTGATGSLGAHIVASLVQDPEIECVYCFVRAQDVDAAWRRTVESMLQRRVFLDLALAQQRKIVALPADLSKPDLGLPKQTYAEIASGLRAVIHAAWSVNFNIMLSSFERDNIAGVRHLIDLCQAGGGSFNFCSSVSVVARHPAEQGPVPEQEPGAGEVQGMGYAQSKWVAEVLSSRAAHETNIPVRVLRIGQIVADTVHGVWNATEAVPLMLQSALTIGVLPRLQETPSWLPVDIVARGVVEISLSDAESSADSPCIFANIVNYRVFSWTDDLLPALHAAGLSFEEVEPREWVQRLRDSNPDPVVNPPIKLLDFFARKYDRNEFAPSKEYVTENARRLSPALANAPLLDTAFVKSFVDQFLLDAWRQRDKRQAIPVA
ncbi:hypothetical protein F5Y19DRAFT_63030 [Xylariaceae sp. FL1651]|nr:hypothetical protein F5Y19DRAFT_63030 [Xylariaceae sp. FL1651]